MLISKHAHYTLDRHKIAVDIDELDQVLADLDSIDDPKAQRSTLERAVHLFRGSRWPAGTRSGPKATSGAFAPPTSSCSSESGTRA